MSGREPICPFEQKNSLELESFLITNFEQVSSDLAKNEAFKKHSNITPQECFRFIYQLRHFMEMHLAHPKIKEEERFMTKLPNKLFFDYSKGGCLQTILECCLKFITERLQLECLDMRSLEVLFDEHKDVVKDMCIYLRDITLEKQMWKAPCVYFCKSGEYGFFGDDEEENGEERKEVRDGEMKGNLQLLKSIVTQHGGIVVKSVDCATHVILKKQSSSQTDRQCLMREIKKQDGRVLVHWRYYPESWDAWYAANSGDAANGGDGGDAANGGDGGDGGDAANGGDGGDVGEEKAPKLPKQWVLCYDWILLSHKFNEWMNENDFAEDESLCLELRDAKSNSTVNLGDRNKECRIADECGEVKLKIERNENYRSSCESSGKGVNSSNSCFKGAAMHSDNNKAKFERKGSFVAAKRKFLKEVCEAGETPFPCAAAQGSISSEDCSEANMSSGESRAMPSGQNSMNSNSTRNSSFPAAGGGLAESNENRNLNFRICLTNAAEEPDKTLPNRASSVASASAITPSSGNSYFYDKNNSSNRRSLESNSTAEAVAVRKRLSNSQIADESSVGVVAAATAAMAAAAATAKIHSASSSPSRKRSVSCVQDDSAPAAEAPKLETMKSSENFDGDFGRKNTKKARIFTESVLAAEENQEDKSSHLERQLSEEVHGRNLQMSSNSSSPPSLDKRGESCKEASAAPEIKPQPPRVPVGCEAVQDGGISIGALSELGKADKFAATDEGTETGDEQDVDISTDHYKDDTSLMKNTAGTSLDDETSLSAKAVDGFLAPQGEGTATNPKALKSFEEDHIASIVDVVKQVPYTQNIYNSVILSSERINAINLNPNDANLNSRLLEIIKPLPRGTAADIPPSNSYKKSAEEASERERENREKEAKEKEKEEIVLPYCAQWFSFDSINQIERDQLSNLFFGSRLTAISKEMKYIQMRNSIINAYRKNPSKFFSATDCRKIIDGDAGLLLRIHSFLDYWGIINFQADPATLPSKMNRLKEFRLKDTVYPGGAWGDNNLKEATLSSLSSSTVAAASYDNKGMMAELKKVPWKAGGPWRCAACGKICLYSYYVIKPGGHITGISLGVLNKCVWCLKCYGDGRYPAVLTEKHFLKVELPILGGEGESGEWTVQQTQRLIDAIELYKEDWESVAQHVGEGKTAHDCISYFIQLPIEEPFLNNVSLSNSDSFEDLPFGDSSNSLLTQLAFLASVVNPTVAAAAAKAAMDAAIDLSTHENKCNLKNSALKDSIEVKQSEPRKSSNEDGECENPAGIQTRDNQEEKKEEEAEAEAEEDTEKKHMSSTAIGETLEESTDLQKNTTSSVSSLVNEISSHAPCGYLTNFDIQVSCATALSAAALKSKQLAKTEEIEIKKLFSILLDYQLQKLDLKIQQFKFIEKQVTKEKAKLDSKFAKHLRERSELKDMLLESKNQSINFSSMANAASGVIGEKMSNNREISNAAAPHDASKSIPYNASVQRFPPSLSS